MLSSLFPSSSTQKRKAPSDTFDPTLECIANSAHKKKKKAVRNRSTKITVLIVDRDRAVPKGASRRKLRDDGYEEVIEVKRNMSSKDIQKVIVKAFGNINYTILAVQDGKFIVGDKQRPTGDELVETLTKRKAPLYICCSEVNSEIDSDIDLPKVDFLKVNNNFSLRLVYINCHFLELKHAFY